MFLTINLAKSAGFCFGVKRAVDTAFKTLSSRPNVYMSGDIVHNEEVIKEMENAGIKKVKKLKAGKNRTFLVRAHGMGLNEINKARLLGYDIVDATCPMVKEIHRIGRDMENKGYKIIVIGDKDHDEVQGIIGQLSSKPAVIEDSAGTAFNNLKKIKKAAIVVQSTQNMAKAVKIARALKPYINELKFFNTVCRPTRLKQEEIKKMPRENDVMVIIGSKTSANTKRLYEISKSINKRSFWVQSGEDIKPRWFKGAQSVGVTAGASTPGRTIKETLIHIATLR